jgi:site-specific recombinase XerD
LVFFYKQVLDKSNLDLQFRHARRGKQLPVVLSRDEIRRLLGEMSGLMAGLMYGTGMRLMECVRLRITRHSQHHPSSRWLVCGAEQPWPPNDLTLNIVTHR